MRILIDILHPAHVHVFRNFRGEMLDRGHEVLVTAREKDVAVDLLEELAIPHQVLSSQRSGTLGLAGELVERSMRLIGVARRFQPTVMMGIMGPAIAPVGRLLRVPSVVFYDSEFAHRTNRFVYPLATFVCTPDSYAGPVNGNHVTYPGYHELAYLHPDRFTPDPKRLTDFGISLPFVVVRFVSWEASHDAGLTSLDPAAKLALVAELQRHTTVVVSSEGPLPPQLEPLRLRGPVTGIHHVLAHADLIVGDSGTMVSEAAVLGTPAVLISPMVAGVHTDQVGYGLLARYSPAEFGAARQEIARLLDEGPPPGALQRLLDEKIEVTTWMIEFIESRFAGMP
jgi:predicted glycosyltransferase